LHFFPIVIWIWIMSKVLFFLLLPILYPTTFLLRSRTVTQCVIRVMSIKSDICNFRPINTSVVNEDHCYYDMTLSSSRWGGMGIAHDVSAKKMRSCRWDPRQQSASRLFRVQLCDTRRVKNTSRSILAQKLTRHRC